MHPKPLPMVAADLPATAGPQHWSMNGRSACAAVAVHRREIGRYRLGIFLLSLFSILLSSCARVSTTGFLKGDTMGTFYTVQYWSDNTLEPQKLDTTIKNVLNEFENQLSNWRHDSWVNRFNASPAHKPIPVPEHAFNVIKLSLELAERTNGAFDPTLSPLIQLWGFGTKRSERIPEEQAIQAALQKVGYQKLVLDTDNSTLLKTDPHMQLNCSAIAKGYAVDLVTKELRQRGVQGALVNIGGEVYAAGTKIDGSPWNVGIQENSSSGQKLRSKRAIPLHYQALATSGHSQRVFFRDGQRYSHVLDPRTGRPVAALIASASIIAPNCALADGLATIALIIDSDAMTQLAGQYNGIEYFYTPWDNQNQGREARLHPDPVERLDPPRNFSHSENRLSSRGAAEG